MTNAVIENILTRRSVRAFQEKPIDREAIETLLQCATHAPSAMNSAPSASSTRAAAFCRRKRVTGLAGARASPG